jgi:hypothetical protein
MPQNTTALPTGTRAFNAVTADTTEAVALFVSNTDGGQLALKELDGVSAGAVTIRVYGVNPDNSATQLAQFVTPTGNFNEKYKGGVFANPQEFLNQKISLKGAQNLGLLGTSGIRVTVQAAAPLAISLGAMLDRRIDGPIS